MFARFTKSLLLEASNNWFIQFGRYLCVTGFSILIDIILLFVLVDFLNIYYLFAACISFSIALVVSFFLNIRWVFTGANLSVKQLIIFSFIGATGMGLNAFLMWLFTSFFGIFYLVSKLLASIITLFWNFNARRRFLVSAFHE